MHTNYIKSCIKNCMKVKYYLFIYCNQYKLSYNNVLTEKKRNNQVATSFLSKCALCKQYQK